jgi:hypothetical protein
MGNPVVAPGGVIHGKSPGPSRLAERITEEFLVETCVDSLVVFAAPVLIRGDGLGGFGVSEDTTADVLVTDLEIRGHQLDEPHFVDVEDTRFFKDFEVGDNPPPWRGEAGEEGGIPKYRIDAIEGRFDRGCLVVGKAETRRFPGRPFVLGGPREGVALRSNSDREGTLGTEGGGHSALRQKFDHVGVVVSRGVEGAVNNFCGCWGVSQVAKIAKERGLHRGGIAAFGLAAKVGCSHRGDHLILGVEFGMGAVRIIPDCH